MVYTPNYPSTISPTPIIPTSYLLPLVLGMLLCGPAITVRDSYRSFRVYRSHISVIGADTSPERVIVPGTIPDWVIEADTIWERSSNCMIDSEKTINSQSRCNVYMQLQSTMYCIVKLLQCTDYVLPSGYNVLTAYCEVVTMYRLCFAKWLQCTDCVLRSGYNVLTVYCEVVTMYRQCIAKWLQCTDYVLPSGYNVLTAYCEVVTMY